MPCLNNSLIFTCSPGLNIGSKPFSCNRLYIVHFRQESVRGHYAAFQIVAELVRLLDTGFDCTDSILLSRPNREGRIVLPEHDSIRPDLANYPPGMQKSVILCFRW